MARTGVRSELRNSPSLRIGAALFATAIVAALAFGPRGPVYWDSFGYVAQAVSGQIGGLGLGRPVFVIVSHAVAIAVRATGASVFTVEPVLRIFWLAIAAFSAPLTFVLAQSCGLTSRGALFAGLAVAFSPAMAHASAAILTDGPSVSVTLLALVLAARAVRAASAGGSGGLKPGPSFCLSGCVLGAAFGLREQSIIYAISLALFAFRARHGTRTRSAALMLAGLCLAAAAPVAYALATQPDYPSYVSRWLQALARERAEHGYGLRDLVAYFGWLVALGPATLAFALVAWTRASRGFTWQITASLAVCAPSIVQLILLAGYQDISYSPRYLLAALPGALAIPAGWALDHFAGDSRRRALAALTMLALPLLFAAPVIRWRGEPTRAAVDAMPALLNTLPSGSVVVTGQPCPAMDLYERLLRTDRGAAASSWQHVCPGWDWPADLLRRLDRALQEGRTVVIDARPGAWVGREQNDARAQAERYALDRQADIDSRRLTVWR